MVGASFRMVALAALEVAWGYAWRFGIKGKATVWGWAWLQIGMLPSLITPPKIEGPHA